MEHEPIEFDTRQAPEKTFADYKEQLGLSEEDLKGSVLDVGAGHGEFVQYLRENLGNKNAFGIDIHLPKITSPEGMAVANGYKLPFADETFDVVVTKDFLPMFVSDNGGYDVLNELIRVVKSGGKIHTTFTTPEDEMQTIEEFKDLAHADEWTKSRLDGSHKLESYLNYLDEKGFGIEYGKGPKDKNYVILRKP